MRGGLESAARWNQHYAQQAKHWAEQGQRALNTLREFIVEEFKPEDVEREGFWTRWYEWAQKHEAVRVAYNNAYHYGHGGSATGDIYHHFIRIVRAGRVDPSAESK